MAYISTLPQKIHYETGQKPKYSKGKVYLNGVPFENYTFTDNYYYMAGDNLAEATDSRYFGLVPEDFIIGACARLPE